MARSRRPSDGPLLFDLPLGTPAEGEAPEEAEPAIPEAPRLSPAVAAAPPRPFAEEWHPVPHEEAGTAAAAPAAAAPAEREWVPARLADRAKAGLADLAVHVGAGLVGLTGAELLGARTDVDDLPAVALFLLAFSFLYTVVPLAFWGHTPGMAWAGLLTRSRGGEPLSFGQTLARWLASVATAATLGLPLLPAVFGRSLGDLLSGSRTYRDPG
jgi:uncharacterized RDD family membrane protein YckC